MNWHKYFEYKDGKLFYKKRKHIGNFKRKENAITARYFWEYFLGYNHAKA